MKQPVATRFAPATLAIVVLVGGLAAGAARAEWMQPDPTLREIQMSARFAARDTVGHSTEPARYDSLGGLLLKLARLDEARAVYAHAADLDPRDTEARAALGKIALFRGHVSEAESLLAAAGPEPGAPEDLLDAVVRSGDYARAAELADKLDQSGRAELLRALAATTPYRLAGGPKEARIVWQSAFPLPLVKVKLDGQLVLMALDTGTADLLLDASAARRCHVQLVPGERPELWSGSRMAVKNAIAPRLELGGMRLEQVPAGVVSLRKWSLSVNPYGETVAGVIGLGVLEQFTPTFDYPRHVLVLRRSDAPAPVEPGAERVPFELWGARELTVYGSINGGRRLAMVVETGVPSCGVGAPVQVFEEMGVRAGMLSRLAKNAGAWLQGRNWSEVTVPLVNVGPIAQDRVHGWAGALDEAELWRHGVRRDAILGGDFFRNRRLTFDWQARELIVEE